MFRLLVQEIPTVELEEVLRFNSAWEAEALGEARGRVTSPLSPRTTGGAGCAVLTEQAAFDRAATLRLGDLLDGRKNVGAADRDEPEDAGAVPPGSGLVAGGHWWSRPGCTV